MAEVVSDQDLLNLDFFNEIDFNCNSIESLDQYLNENHSSDDKIESNIGIHSFLPVINDNKNDLNANNQWLHTIPNDIHYQFNGNRFETNANDFGYERVDQPFLSQTAIANTLFGGYNYFDHFPNRKNVDNWSSDRCNGLQFNDNIFHQNFQVLENQTGVPSTGQSQTVDPLQTEALPEVVTQLNGQLLSTQEFEKQNHLELFCEEKMDAISLKSSKSLDKYEVPKEGLPSLEQPLSLEVGVESNNKKVEGNTFPQNRKTYSRLKSTCSGPKTMEKASPPPSLGPVPPPLNPAMSNETMAAVKGLVMLSNGCRQSVIRPKAKKGNVSQLSFAERQRLKRERNRIASKKCRQKKLETIERLELMKEILFEENQKCELYLKNSRQRLMELKQFLLHHRLNECQLPYNLNI